MNSEKQKMSLEEQIKTAAESAVLKHIREGGWIMLDYENRLKLPRGILDEVFKLIDWEAMKIQLKAKIEGELVDRLMNQMATELSTDVKQILCNQERRECLRAVIRENIDRLTGKVK